MKVSCITKLICLGAILSISPVLFALPNITGNWKCTGYDPMQKKNFTESGEIKKIGDTYSLINWQEEGSSETRSGMGIHNNKMKDSLAVIFWPNETPEKIGFGLYQVKSMNKIVGIWTMKNEKVTAEETCVRIKA